VVKVCANFFFHAVRNVETSSERKFWNNIGTSITISGNQKEEEKKLSQITQKIFRVATFSNGRSGAGNKPFFNFGLIIIL
jgi:hypothetical protein